MIWNGIDVGAIVTMLLLMILPPIFLYIANAAKNALALGVDEWNKLVWAKLNNEEKATITAVVNEGVLMAEQIIKRPDVQDYAKAKKDAAFKYVDDQLAKYGISLSADEISNMIEAAVQQVFNKPAQAVAVTPAK